MNRAVQGDVVAVEVFPESEWKASADEVIDQEGDQISRQFSNCTALISAFQLPSKTMMQRTLTRKKALEMKYKQNERPSKSRAPNKLLRKDSLLDE